MFEELIDKVKALDVGEAVVKLDDLKAKIDPAKVKEFILDFKDNAKYDNAKSLLRSGKDFLTNYPRYYIEGLVGTIQDKLGK